MANIIYIKVCTVCEHFEKHYKVEIKLYVKYLESVKFQTFQITVNILKAKNTLLTTIKHTLSENAHQRLANKNMLIKMV